MKEPKGYRDMPDFKQLNDRIIVEPSDEPALVIKTNLDPRDPTVENPYFSKDTKDKEVFNDFFDER